MILRRYGVLAVAALAAVGLVVSGCTKTAEKPPAATSASPAASAPAAEGDLTLLVPVPANTTTNRGPDPLADNGAHRYFEVSGSPADVMAAFKTALEGKGWQVTTASSGERGEGGGATFTGTLGDVYGVFEGGGYETTTYIDACTWPTKPADPQCRDGR